MVKITDCYFYFQLIPFVILMLLGVSSYYHSPVIFEDNGGLLLPFFYSTYYCRDRRDDSDPATDKMLDPAVDLLRELYCPCKTQDIGV